MENQNPKWNFKKAINRQIKQKSISTMTQLDIDNLKPAQLMPFRNQGSNPNTQQPSLPFNFIDYIELVDWTGRIAREDKRGFIKETTPPILERLSINDQEWLINSNQFEKVFNKQFNRRQIKANSS